MKILITGITGQIGSYLAELYLSHDVYGLVRRTSQNSRKNISHIEHKLNLVEGDVTDYASLHRAFDIVDPNIVINCAAQSHVHTSFSNPLTTWDITAKGVINLLELIRTRPHCKFLQFSSSEMFGQNYDYDISFSAYDIPKYQDENTKMDPESPYAIAKLAAYNSVRLYRKAYGLFTSNIIAFNSESPRRGENFVTQKIIKWLKEFNSWRNDLQNPYRISTGLTFDKEHIVCYTSKFPKLRLGNIHSYRDWTFAGDTAKACKLILEQDKPDDYCVCTGVAHTIEEFLVEAFKYYDLQYQDYIYRDRMLFRPSEVPYLCGKNDKIGSLGWKPTVNLPQLVKMMIEDGLR